MKKTLLLAAMSLAVLTGCNDDNKKVNTNNPQETTQSEKWVYVKSNPFKYADNEVFTVNEEIYILKDGKNIYSTPFPDITNFAPLFFNYYDLNGENKTLPLYTETGIYETKYDSNKKEYKFGTINSETDNYWKFSPESVGGSSTLEFTFNFNKIDISDKTLTEVFQIIPEVTLSNDSLKFPKGSACLNHKSTKTNETLLSSFRTNLTPNNAYTYSFGNNIYTNTNAYLEHKERENLHTFYYHTYNSELVYSSGYFTFKNGFSSYNNIFTNLLIENYESLNSSDKYCTLFNETAINYLKSIS